MSLKQMKPITVELLPFWSLSLPVLLFFTLNFQSCGAVSSLLGNDTDHLCLLKFKESISNDPYHILDSWNASTHLCDWYGITCGRKHQRVTRLELNGYQLRGSVSPTLGNLSFLRVIDLNNNHLHGEIPPELGRLFRLQQLGLSNNTLIGEFPVNVTSCSNLRYLSIGGNNLVGKIPINIGSLHKLEQIFLPVNKLTGQIPISMWNLSSLTVLCLTYNYLEGNIPEEIGRLGKLEKILFGANKFSGAIPSSVYNMSSLIKIVVAENQISCSLLTNMFLALPNLKTLELGFNGFLGPIPTSIVNASRLTMMSIPGNHFVGKVQSLGQLPNLSSVELGGNNFGSGSANDLEFLKSLINCSELELIDIGDNNFGGQLPNTIGNLSTQLTTLYLDDNRIVGKIPPALGDVINLRGLKIRNNDLTGTIPTNFGKLQKVQLLSLGGNRLSGEITPFIGNLTQLYKLDLSNNMLEGHIPPSIGICEKLQYLDLSQNNFDGAIPTEIFGLPSLSTFLNLSHNLFRGDLPDEVGKLRNIETLDVSQNYLSGNIPETIGDCKSLEYLLLHRNFFQEIIPLSLTLLKGLQYLDLSQNNLSGSIPRGLQDISTLEYCNVSFNMLGGEVPDKGVFKNASAIFLTGNIELCGGIPELKLRPCPAKVNGERKHHTFILIAAICCVAAFLLVLSLVFAILHKRKRSKKFYSDSPTIGLLTNVSYQRLHNATDGFSTNNLIGSGRYGFVYKGILEFHEVVAIKVLKLQVKGAHKSFMSECNSLRDKRHRNLVKILTCCSSMDYKGHEFKALVYEYMVNGSLENWLHPGTEDSNHPRILLLDQILNILIDIAAALQYLHYECEQPLVHCDLKPSNILLDGNMVAHLSDFGLARLLSSIQGISNKQSSTIGIKGTIGYVPPEYGMGSEVSIQGDMYSFGILVFEMLTKRRPTENMFKDGHNLHEYVEIAFPNKLLQIVSPTIFPIESEHTMPASEDLWEKMIQIHPNVEKYLCSLFHIGLACSMESPHERMSAVDVIKELNSIKSSFPFW